MKRIKDCFTFIFHIHASIFYRMAGAPDCELDVTSVSVCFEDQVGVDEELTESETEEASLSLQRLLTTGKNFASVPKPIPIPSHKRRPVVKYEGGKKVFFNVWISTFLVLQVKNDLFCMHEPFCKSLSEKRQFHQIYSRPRML